MQHFPLCPPSVIVTEVPGLAYFSAPQTDPRLAPAPLRNHTQASGAAEALATMYGYYSQAD